MFLPVCTALHYSLLLSGRKLCIKLWSHFIFMLMFWTLKQNSTAKLSCKQNGITWLHSLFLSVSICQTTEPCVLQMHSWLLLLWYHTCVLMSLSTYFPLSFVRDISELDSISLNDDVVCFYGRKCVFHSIVILHSC